MVVFLSVPRSHNQFLPKGRTRCFIVSTGKIMHFTLYTSILFGHSLLDEDAYYEKGPESEPSKIHSFSLILSN